MRTGLPTAESSLKQNEIGALIADASKGPMQGYVRLSGDSQTPYALTPQRGHVIATKALAQLENETQLGIGA